MPPTRDTAHASRGQAEANAEAVRPVIERLQASGITSQDGLAYALNREGVPAPRGGRWYGPSVRNLLIRLNY